MNGEIYTGLESSCGHCNTPMQLLQLNISNIYFTCKDKNNRKVCKETSINTSGLLLKRHRLLTLFPHFSCASAVPSWSPLFPFCWLLLQGIPRTQGFTVGLSWSALAFCPFPALSAMTKFSKVWKEDGNLSNNWFLNLLQWVAKQELQLNVHWKGGRRA